MYRQQHTQSEMTTEMKKNEYKTLTLQQKDHIATLMERLDSEKRFSEKLCGEKYDLEKELQEVKAKVLTDQQLEALQGEARKSGRTNGYEDAEAEFEPYKKQRELDEALSFRASLVNALDALREEFKNYVDTHDVTTADYQTIYEELAQIKNGKFDCDVYWTATDGNLCVYKIPNEIACLNTKDGDNAVLEAFQNGYFGTEWGTYSGFDVLEMTREQLEEELGEELVERKGCGDPDCLECDGDAEEPETPKSTKDLVIDQLNEEPHTPAAPAFEPLHEDATHQVVRGFFGVEFVWKVPAGINLRDTDTYEFGDKWGCLYISNKITGEEFQIEDRDEEDDFKRAHTLEVEDRDDDDNTY